MFFSRLCLNGQSYDNYKYLMIYLNAKEFYLTFLIWNYFMKCISDLTLLFEVFITALPFEVKFKHQKKTKKTEITKKKNERK